MINNQEEAQGFLDPDFFPTPKRIIEKILGSVNTDARYFLEPSAGRGDLAEAINVTNGFHWRQGIEIDCIESSPDLCSVLTGKGFSVVGSDWLTYDGVSYYDAIVMNPPFSQGARHLLKAWDFMYSGEIVCLLNSETLRNPHTAERKLLAAIVEEHGRVEELGACFTSAARRSDVEVSLVYLSKTSTDDRVELWDTGTEEAELGDLLEDANLPAVRDRLGNMQRFYDEANRHMLLAFEHARKAATYLDANNIYHGSGDYHTILGQSLKTNLGHSRAEFLRAHRKDAWLSVFRMMDFHKWLREDLLEKFILTAVRGRKWIGDDRGVQQSGLF